MFSKSGSLARTGHGLGTDWALVGGTALYCWQTKNLSRILPARPRPNQAATAKPTALQLFHSLAIPGRAGEFPNINAGPGTNNRPVSSYRQVIVMTGKPRVRSWRTRQSAVANSLVRPGELASPLVVSLSNHERAAPRQTQGERKQDPIMSNSLHRHCCLRSNLNCSLSRLPTARERRTLQNLECVCPAFALPECATFGPFSYNSLQCQAFAQRTGPGRCPKA